MGRRYRRGNHFDSTRYYDWLDCAGDDLQSAKLLATNEDCYNASAFHCQQAIEKALKAFILVKCDELVDGHNLTWLCKRALRYERRFAEWLDESAALNRCYIETRYPADRPLELDYAAVSSYCKMAGDMFEFICGEVGDYVRDV